MDEKVMAIVNKVNLRCNLKYKIKENEYLRSLLLRAYIAIIDKDEISTLQWFLAEIRQTLNISEE
jgi:hypothetical protein